MDVSPQPSGMTDHDNDREIDSGDEEEQDEEFKIRLRKELIMQKDLPEHITEDDFKNYLKSYPNYVREVYDRLETARFKIGDKIPGRKPPHLTRDELIEMDKWMQKRGTSLKKEYHQRNAKIIETNSKEDVKKISSRAFQKYCNQKGNDLEDRGKRSKKGKVEINSQERDEEEGGEASVDDALKAMGILENLKGVARARSSLLLSVAFRRTVPYLSRALYRWMNWDDETGWTQACTWTSGTKKQLLVKVRDMAKKFDVGAVDVEKVAFVLECEGRIAGLRNASITKGLVKNADQQGIGAHGTVFQVPAGTGRGFGNGIVAIKKIPRGILHVDTERHRFLAEVGISSQLPKVSPHHFVQFRGWNQDEDNLYIAMECIPHGDLESSLKNHPKGWTETAIREAAQQILDGLYHMHNASIAHRDLKPQNILVVSPPANVKVKIADFGVAKRLSNRGTTFLRTTTGTAGYKAPEVARYWDREGSSKNPDMYSFNVDIWSLGCIIYRMAKGERLFIGDGDVLSKRRLKNKVKHIKNQLGACNVNEEVKPCMGSSGISFVCSLMVIKPKKRPDAHMARESLAQWKVL